MSVVMRTGATEIHQKLPVQLDTTLRCLTDLLIFSDYEETVRGQVVRNVLQHVNETLVAREPDFAIYRHLQQLGREGLANTTFEGSSAQGSDNPGWKLDRFKFLPMMEETLRHRPNAMWYVFVEPDTYLLWPNLIDYLATMDASEALYLGRRMYNLASPVPFAYGGSGFILSQPALQRIVEHRNAYLDDYDRFTVKEWAGDFVLGKLAQDAGIPFKRALSLQREPVSEVDPLALPENQSLWCLAPVSYHHMHVDAIADLYTFEQTWRRQNPGAQLQYRHILREYIVPKLSDDDVSGWDNLSSDTQPLGDAIPTDSAADCRRQCQANPDCLQYSHLHGDCHIATRVRHGRKLPQEAGHEAMRSGWMRDRILRFADAIDMTCDDEDARPEGNGNRGDVSDLIL